MMDTKFWIWLKDNPQKYEAFRRTTDDLEVLFSAGNFYDLLKAYEQDQLSEIIAESVDFYIPMQSREGHFYDYSDDPASLIPTPDARSTFAHETRLLDEDLKLQYLFRTADWEIPEAYLEMTDTMKDLHDAHGFENAMGYIFREYLQDDGEKLLLHQEQIEPVDFIRGMLELHRIEQIQDDENPDGNDFADMLICSHGILTECDALFLEEKWINQGVIENVIERLTLDGPKLHKEYSTFLSTIDAKIQE
jgi:hypothetical protein